jgi:cation transporter-like permease
VAFLLYICQILCRVFWIRGYVPDLNSIPLLTALGDLLGAALLLGAISANPWMAKEEGKTTTMKMNF